MASDKALSGRSAPGLHCLSAYSTRRRPDSIAYGRRNDHAYLPQVRSGHATLRNRRRAVKNPGRRTYHKRGSQEFCLLEQLDGNRSAAEILAAFEAKFGEPITVDDLHEFVEMVSELELLNKQL